MKKITMGLELGSTKVCALAAEVTENKKLKIIGFGEVKSEGIEEGKVVNVDKTTANIQQAFNQAKGDIPMHDITSIYVGISNANIKTKNVYSEIILKDKSKRKIINKDIEDLKKQSEKIPLDSGDIIIDIYPQDYRVDGEQSVSDPVGRYGHKLGGNFHIILCKEEDTENIKECVDTAGIPEFNLFFEPIASCLSTLSPEDMEGGVCLVDIGGGTTDLTIFKNNQIKHTSVLPFGGNAVTNDLAKEMKLNLLYAEKIKKEYGSAICQEETKDKKVTIQPYPNVIATEISQYALSQIIKARMKEIGDWIAGQIINNGFKSKLTGGIILTGGGAQLKDLKHLLAGCTGENVYIGTPNNKLAPSDFNQQLNTTQYATLVGLLILEDYFNDSHDEKNNSSKKKNPINWAMAKVLKVIEKVQNGKKEDYK